MHNISKCKRCYQRKAWGCEAFNDMHNPITENGKCIGAIYKRSDYKKLKRTLKKINLGLL